MVLTGEQLNPQKVFTTIALIGTTQAVAQQFAYAYIVLSRWLPSLERMEDFLTKDSISKNRPGESVANVGLHDQGNEHKKNFPYFLRCHVFIF